jgi:hypothetical protein
MMTAVSGMWCTAVESSCTLNMKPPSPLTYDPVPDIA